RPYCPQASSVRAKEATRHWRANCTCTQLVSACTTSAHADPMPELVDRPLTESSAGLPAQPPGRSSCRVSHPPLPRLWSASRGPPPISGQLYCFTLNPLPLPGVMKNLMTADIF
ncbi:hypothetical protein BaRGS_00012509, partial [Batillaria attramentaria]